NGSSIIDQNGVDVTSLLAGGSLQAQTDFISTSPPAASSTTPGVGVISKLQSQLSKLVDAFTNSSGTTPSAFATAYTNAYNASTTGVAATFFTVTNNGSGVPDPSTFQVTASLINGTTALPQTNTQTVAAPAGLISAIAASFDSTANYTASGLAATSVNYA